MAYTPSHNFNSTSVNEIMSLGFKDQKVIDAIISTKRADFVTQEYKKYADNDYYLSYCDDRFLQARHTLVSMFLNMNYNYGQSVAAIGVGTGYLAVLLAKIFKKVSVLETEKDYKEMLLQNTKLFKNIKLAEDLQNLNNNCDFIIVENFLTYTHKELAQKLNEDGFILYIEQEKGVNYLFLEDKKGNKTKLDVLIAAPLKELKQNDEFVF